MAVRRLLGPTRWQRRLNPLPLTAGMMTGDTHHLVLADPLCGLDGPVQTGFAKVHILSVGIAGQQT